MLRGVCKMRRLLKHVHGRGYTTMRGGGEPRVAGRLDEAALARAYISGADMVTTRSGQPRLRALTDAPDAASGQTTWHLRGVAVRRG